MENPYTMYSIPLFMNIEFGQLGIENIEPFDNLKYRQETKISNRILYQIRKYLFNCGVNYFSVFDI